MTFDAWFERHGSALKKADARIVWNAAIRSACDVTHERSIQQRERSLGDGIDGEYAAAKFLEGRAIYSAIFALEARA